jgi:hypothetical protein
METKKLIAGHLRSIAYEAANRTLRVRFDDGHEVEHAPVGAEMWRRFTTSGSAWSYYRDVIEEEIPGRRVSEAGQTKTRASLDDLFKPH